MDVLLAALANQLPTAGAHGGIGGYRSGKVIGAWRPGHSGTSSSSSSSSGSSHSNQTAQVESTGGAKRDRDGVILSRMLNHSSSVRYERRRQAFDFRGGQGNDSAPASACNDVEAKGNAARKKASKRADCYRHFYSNVDAAFFNSPQADVSHRVAHRIVKPPALSSLLYMRWHYTRND
jgi:hypothetical protein